MKYITKYISFTLLLGLTSCGLYGNLTSNQNQNQTSVVLSEANFKYIGTVSGEVSQTYILGFGGIRPKALKDNAIDKMMREARRNNPDLMTGSKAITNISVEQSIKMITPFYVKCTVTAHGTIIEFTK